MNQWRPPQFRKGDVVFWRASGRGKAAKWKRATVNQFAQYDNRTGEPLYSVYVPSTKASLFTVPEADLALADIDALTEVEHG